MMKILLLSAAGALSAAVSTSPVANATSPRGDRSGEFHTDLRHCDSAQVIRYHILEQRVGRLSPRLRLRLEFRPGHMPP